MENIEEHSRALIWYKYTLIDFILATGMTTLYVAIVFGAMASIGNY